MILPAVYGVFSQGLLLAALLVALRPNMRTGRAAFIPGVVCAATIFVPLGGPTAAEHLRAIWGDPSVVTTLLLVLFVLWPKRLPPRLTHEVAWGVSLLVAAFLYLPMVLPTFTNFYADGWNSPVVPAFLVALAVYKHKLIDSRWVVIVAIAMLAFAAGLMESSNLWDYLVDPGLLVGLVLMSRPRSARVSPQSVQHSPAAP